MKIKNHIYLSLKEAKKCKIHNFNLMYYVKILMKICNYQAIRIRKWAKEVKPKLKLVFKINPNFFQDKMKQTKLSLIINNQFKVLILTINLKN